MAERQITVIAPELAYPRGRRVRHAFWFIRRQARISGEAMERTKARFVAMTYGVEESLVKRIKARFRNELSFSEGK